MKFLCLDWALVIQSSFVLLPSCRAFYGFQIQSKNVARVHLVPPNRDSSLGPNSKQNEDSVAKARKAFIEAEDALGQNIDSPYLENRNLNVMEGSVAHTDPTGLIDADALLDDRQIDIMVGRLARGELSADEFELELRFLESQEQNSVTEILQEAEEDIKPPECTGSEPIDSCVRDGSEAPVASNDLFVTEEQMQKKKEYDEEVARAFEAQIKGLGDKNESKELKNDKRIQEIEHQAAAFESLKLDLRSESNIAGLGNNPITPLPKEEQQNHQLKVAPFPEKKEIQKEPSLEKKDKHNHVQKPHIDHKIQSERNAQPSIFNKIFSNITDAIGSTVKDISTDISASVEAAAADVAAVVVEEIKSTPKRVVDSTKKVISESREHAKLEATRKAAQAAKYKKHKEDLAKTAAKKEYQMRLEAQGANRSTNEKKEQALAAKRLKLAPEGVPTISMWFQNGDGTIEGSIQGSPSYPDGNMIKTSAIEGKVESGTVVETSSGSKYFLGELKTVEDVEAKRMTNLATEVEQTTHFEEVVDEEERQDKLKAEARKMKDKAQLEEKQREDAIAKAKKQKAIAQRKARIEAKRREEALEKYKRERDVAESNKKAEEERRKEAIKLEALRRKVISDRKAVAEAKRLEVEQAEKSRIEKERKARAQAKLIEKKRLKEANYKRQQALKQRAAEELKAKMEAKRLEEIKRNAIKEMQAKEETQYRGTKAVKIEDQGTHYQGTKAVKADDQGTHYQGTKAVKADNQETYYQGTKAVKADGQETYYQGTKAVKADNQETYYQGTKAVKADNQESQTPFFDNPLKNTMGPGLEYGKTLPEGIPALVEWTQLRDGSISGFVKGSSAFEDGEQILTEPIIGVPEEGSIVETYSGSKFYLQPLIRTKVKGTVHLSMSELKRKQADAKRLDATAAAAKAKKLEDKERKAKAEAFRQKKERAKPNHRKPEIKYGEPSMGENVGTYEIKRKPKEIKSFLNFSPFQNIMRSVSKPKQAKAKSESIPTFYKWKQNSDGSIVGIITGSSRFEDGDLVETMPLVTEAVGGGLVEAIDGERFFLSDSKAVISGDLKKTPTKQHPTESAISDIPAEMPFLMEWKKNRDGTITGFISGSPSFADGERITTSKIANGALKSGEIVETGSGSKYFLF